ncbi:hypothetical protein [Lentzea guizhouensis]|nr:hypothetical protein [Lentzea guizhouensis]
MTTDDGPEPRMALRRGNGSLLDDVSVRDVSLFHAEMMDQRTLWIGCYLEGTGVEHDRVTFMVTARGNRLVFEVVEQPEGNVPLEG